MIWFHEKVLGHRVTSKELPAVWVHHGQRPQQVLYRCSCRKTWTRR